MRSLPAGFTSSAKCTVTTVGASVTVEFDAGTELSYFACAAALGVPATNVSAASESPSVSPRASNMGSIRGRAVRLTMDSTLLVTIRHQSTGYSAANDNVPAYISPSGVRLIWLGENTFGPSRERQCFCAYRAVDARSPRPIRAFMRVFQ